MTGQKGVNMKWGAHPGSGEKALGKPTDVIWNSHPDRNSEKRELGIGVPKLIARGKTLDLSRFLPGKVMRKPSRSKLLICWSSLSKTRTLNPQMRANRVGLSAAMDPCYGRHQVNPRGLAPRDASKWDRVSNWGQRSLTGAARITVDQCQ